MKKEKLYTPWEFGYKHKLSRSTVWRYMNTLHYKRYLKMYDAEVVTVAGKKFIRLTK
jgi:DNA-binding IclR family transcriptional regulator